MRESIVRTLRKMIRKRTITIYVFVINVNIIIFSRIYFNLNDECNSKCNCNEYKFDPVCGANNVMYYSPCYAGCGEEYTIGDSKVVAITFFKYNICKRYYK